MSEEVTRVMWSYVAKRPSTWFGNAECFERAVSELLKPVKEDETNIVVPDGKGGLRIFVPPLSPPLRGVITLLWGLAIENQVKAILVALKADDFITDEELNQAFTTHKLQELVRKANSLRPNLIPLKGKTMLLEKLTLVVEWGKYGVPKTAAELYKSSQRGFPPIPPKCGHPLTDDEVAACKTLYDDLKQTYLSVTGHINQNRDPLSN
jgi:hypothetical protein